MLTKDQEVVITNNNNHHLKMHNYIIKFKNYKATNNNLFKLYKFKNKS